MSAIWADQVIVMTGAFAGIGCQGPNLFARSNRYLPAFECGNFGGA